MNHKIKQFLIIIALALFNTGCEKDPASSPHPIPDGLLISYPDDYVDGILTVEVEGEEDDHEDHEDEGEHILVGGFQLELEDHDDDDHDDHDHGDEEHCEDFTTESDCGMHSECEWHEDDSACEDADEDHDDHDEEDHGEYAYRQLGLEIDGTITIDVGQTLEFSVHFLDSSGNELEDHEDHDEEDHEDHEDEDHEDHGMIIEVTGVSVGTTSFQIQLMHDGHSDYTSLPITVTVVN